MSVIVQRALTPFAFAILVIMTALVILPELRDPAPMILLGATALLLMMRPIEREIRSNSRYKTRVIVVGQRPIARRFMDEVERFPERGYTIVGIVEETPGAAARSQYLVLGSVLALRTIVGAVKPDLIVVAFSDRRGKMPTEELLGFQANGIRVEDAAEAYERVSGKLPIEAVTPGQLMASQRLRKSRALKAAQRFLSFSAALVLLTLAAPLLALIALAIKFDSGAPVLFLQTRLGKNCLPFRLMKFRTMQPVDRAPSEWVDDNRERITRIGKWLRRFRLDELPQLVNVLRGEMNLVGPRPHPVTNLQLFRDSIPYYALRGSVLPGITGWAQVRYHYANNLEEETEKMRYDLYYIKHMSLWMDFSIILRTCAVFVRSFRSTFESKKNTVKRPAFTVGPTRIPIRRPVVQEAARQSTRDHAYDFLND